jgi:hypothetical protein
MIPATSRCREELAALEDEPEPTPMHRHSGEIVAFRANRPLDARFQAGDRPEQGRLARPGRPEQRQHLAVGYLQPGVAYGRK